MERSASSACNRAAGAALYDLTALALGAVLYGLAWLAPFTHSMLPDPASDDFSFALASMLVSAWIVARLFRRWIRSKGAWELGPVALAATPCGGTLFLWIWLLLGGLLSGQATVFDALGMLVPITMLGSLYALPFLPVAWIGLLALRAVARPTVRAT